MADQIVPWVYEHYKGKRYLVVGIAHDSNRDGRVVVVYMPLYEAEPDNPRAPRMAVRTLSDFNQWMHFIDGKGYVPCETGPTKPGGARCRVGKAHRKRFKYVGPRE